MAWETRQRGGRYYTRSRRQDGRVVREYVGGGAVGEFAALHDAQESRRRKEADERGRVMLDQLKPLVTLVGELDEAADTMLRAYLVAGGYRKRNGQWRIKRD